MLFVCSPAYFNEEKRYSAMERLAALHYDPDGEKGFARLVVIESCEIPRLMEAIKRLHLHDLSREDARKRLIEYFQPAVRPTSEPAFPGIPRPSEASSRNEPGFPGTKPPRPTIVDTSALPNTSLVKLRGREPELAELDAAWADPGIHVFSIVAWGGQGKTALVSHWVDQLRAEGGRGAEVILGWSFYDQGTKERATSADRFLDWALKKLGLPDPGPRAPLKAEKIAEALQARRVLLILDGIDLCNPAPVRTGDG